MKINHVTKKLRIKMTPAERTSAFQRIIEPAKPSGSFYLMVCLSAIIATFGLLADSTAVVIGAMLVAPLMSPIFGIALGLTTGDRKLLRMSLFAEIIGIVLAICLPALIGLIPLRPDFGMEIMARTQPTIYDVVIALASGLAGAYALVKEKISPALPGVAIATALVPPLAVCGLNLAAGNWSLAWSALLLFIINFIAIEFAAAGIFMWFGLVEFKAKGNHSPLTAIIRHMGISFVILVLATTFMTQTLISIIGERKMDKEIRDVLTEQLNTYAGARLSDVKYYQTDRGLDVRAVVITPQEIEPSRVAGLEKALQIEVNPDAQLIIRSLISKDADRNGPVFLSEEDKKIRNALDQETAYMNKVSLIISEQMKTHGGAEVVNVTKETSDGRPTIIASVRHYQPVTPAEVETVQQHLQDEVDSTIRLIVRSNITQDADSQGYLYPAIDFKDNLQEEELDLYNRLANEIKWYLSYYVTEGVTLSELSFVRTEGTLDVYTEVNTPLTIQPEQVSNLQAHLQKNIDPQLEIVIKSVVGGTATANNYVSATNETGKKVIPD